MDRINRLKVISYFLIFCILLAAVQAILPMIFGTINFHVDVARDFLVIRDILQNHKITLIGPRSGGIPGVFHGPLWLYLNIPSYLLGQGDPIVVGYGWFVMWVVGLLIAYKSYLCSVDQKIALFAVTVQALLTAEKVSNFFNPSGALLITPVWFTLLLLYKRKGHWKYLLGAFILNGILIQFQMAFGVPMLILSSFYVMYQIFRNKKLHHMGALLGVTPFLSTFILFDLRHQFLQSHAVINHLLGITTRSKAQSSLALQVINRFWSSIAELLGIITLHRIFVLLIIVAIVFLIVKHLITTRKFPQGSRDLISLTLYFWFGYWCIVLGYRGTIWTYYYDMFTFLIPLTFAIFVFNIKTKRIIFLCGLYLCVLGITNTLNIVPRVLNAQTTPGEWSFISRSIGKIMFAESAPKEFGYFVFTHDQLGYDPYYTIAYLAQVHKIQAHENIKKSFVYVYADTKPHPVANFDYWLQKQVGITKKPYQTHDLGSGFVMQLYKLTPEEQKVPVDQNLIQNLIFR